MDANTLAIVVLVFLILTFVGAILIVMRSTLVEQGKGLHAILLPVFSLLGLPAIIDLMQTEGITRYYAIIVFLVLLLTITMPLLGLTRRIAPGLYQKWWNWQIPLIVFAGLFVAGYLAYVELTTTAPVCGVGLPGCVTVQNSEYARLYGVIPIGIIGIAGYSAILGVWFIEKICPTRWKRYCTLAIWGMCLFGVIFSAYLTYLEPFVIHATCSWCVTSAVLMILLLWVSSPNAQSVLLQDEEE